MKLCALTLRVFHDGSRWRAEGTCDCQAWGSGNYGQTSIEAVQKNTFAWILHKARLEATLIREAGDRPTIQTKGSAQ